MDLLAVLAFAFATNDLDKTVRFWRDLLGMRLIAGIGTETAGSTFLRLVKIV